LAGGKGEFFPLKRRFVRPVMAAEIQIGVCQSAAAEYFRAFNGMFL